MCRMQQLKAVSGLGWRQRMVKCSLPQLQRVSLAHPQAGAGSPGLGIGLGTDAASGTQPHSSPTCHTLGSGSRAHFYGLIKM